MKNHYLDVLQEPLKSYSSIYIGTASQTLLTNDTNYVCDAGYIHTNA